METAGKGPKPYNFKAVQDGRAAGSYMETAGKGPKPYNFKAAQDIRGSGSSENTGCTKRKRIKEQKKKEQRM
ncbi:MAG: hypothetical protein J5961_03210 [Mogibacterium sp.]|nr:hypothetical protein [Mogibacterium sp.]